MASTLQAVIPLNSAEAARSLRFIYRCEPLAALVALICALPLMIMLAAVIAVLARRAPLVRHKRAGFQDRDLDMLKFRTMWEQHAAWAPLFIIENVADAIPDLKDEIDPRVTSRFAAFCRRYSLDELPQAFHVLRGEMSFVGPRPITRGELDEHYHGSAGVVLSVRPGLTGLWQSMGRSRLTYRQRRRLDVWFVQHASAGLYFRIFTRTIPRVVQGHDAL